MTEHSTDGTYRCPYPNCDWEPSRPVESEVGLTQAVVRREFKKHREVHTDKQQRSNEADSHE